MASGESEKGPVIEVETEAEFVREESHPTLNHYHFAYHINIKNKGDAPAQLISRHWIITNGKGAIHEVKGEGVVGKQPVLNPGQEFTYTSACPLDTPIGMMQGSYHMVDGNGRPFDVAIEPFILTATASHN
jgi:ApaG protein